jgi:hypothetical protein
MQRLARLHDPCLSSARHPLRARGHNQGPYWDVFPGRSRLPLAEWRRDVSSRDSDHDKDNGEESLPKEIAAYEISESLGRTYVLLVEDDEGI